MNSEQVRERAIALVCLAHEGSIFTNQEFGMNTTAFLDLTIARRGRQYFVILIDALEVNEVGPFKSKKERNYVANASRISKS